MGLNEYDVVLNMEANPHIKVDLDEYMKISLDGMKYENHLKSGTTFNDNVKYTKVAVYNTKHDFAIVENEEEEQHDIEEFFKIDIPERDTEVTSE